MWIVLGGPGALGDLADDADLATLLQGAAADGAIVMAVDHGASALAARPRRGDPLTAGRRVTGPSDAEARRAAVDHCATVRRPSSGSAPPAGATTPAPPADRTSSSTATS